MMKECEIVKDLMPNYIDELTSQDSREFVEKHLETCTECRSYLNEMRSGIELKNKDTIKQEIDYMKKAKKKMKIGEKLIVIIGFLIIITVMLFWREIYQGILYLDICKKHMYWQEQIIEKGSYKLTITNYPSGVTYYCNKEKIVAEYFDESNEVNKTAVYNESDIPNTKIQYMYHSGMQDDNIFKDVNLKVYCEESIMPQHTDEANLPYMSYFTFEKSNLWDLMKTIKNVISIRIEHINDKDYYILYLDNGLEIWVDKYNGLIESCEGDRYKLDVTSNIDEKLIYPDNEEYIILADYENDNRDKGETTVKISNCEEEAGKIVDYNFKVENGEDDSLKWFAKTNYENIRILKINNNITYKKMQERWKNLRDLTAEDFEHYFVFLIVDTDNSREVEFKELTSKDEYSRMLNVTEKDAEGEYLYSGSLVIIPNSMDVKATGATILSYGVTVE